MKIYLEEFDNDLIDGIQDLYMTYFPSGCINVNDNQIVLVYNEDTDGENEFDLTFDIYGDDPYEVVQKGKYIYLPPNMNGIKLDIGKVKGDYETVLSKFDTFFQKLSKKVKD